MRTFFLTALLIVPAFGYAATTLNSIITAFTSTIGTYLVPMLMGVALVVFIWGLVVFIAHAGDEKAVAEGKQRMIWGIVGLSAIVAVWGIVQLVILIFGIGGTPTCTPVQIGDDMTVTDCI